MTWPWPISSKLPFLVFVAMLLLANLPAATVTGGVRLVGSSKASVTKHGDFSNVVIWLEPRGGLPVYTPGKRVQMVQKNKMFSPHILAISAGTVIEFPNLDLIFHNAFSNFNGKIFDIGLYPPGSTRAERFERPGIVRVFCNIHPAMSAVIVIVNSQCFTKTAADGRFAIGDVQPGSYEIHFFHERASPEKLEMLTRKVTVSGDFDVSTIDISETGYLPAGHKNKYGRDYPRNAGEEGTYSFPLK